MNVGSGARWFLGRGLLDLGDGWVAFGWRRLVGFGGVFVVVGVGMVLGLRGGEWSWRREG